MSLELIIGECRKEFKVTKELKPRDQRRIHARMCFYYYAFEYVTRNKSELARFVKLSHSSVHVALSKVDEYRQHRTEFKKGFDNLSITIGRMFNRNIDLKMSDDEIKIQDLKIEIAEKEEVIKALRAKLETDIPIEIREMLAILPPEQVRVCIKTRINPFVTMFLSDRRRYKRLFPLKEHNENLSA